MKVRLTCLKPNEKTPKTDVLYAQKHVVLPVFAYAHESFKYGGGGGQGVGS